MFQGLPITLALVKEVNKNLSNENLPENLSNEILLCSLYQGKEINRKVLKKIMNSIKL